MSEAAAGPGMWSVRPEWCLLPVQMLTPDACRARTWQITVDPWNSNESRQSQTMKRKFLLCSKWQIPVDPGNLSSNESALSDEGDGVIYKKKNSSSASTVANLFSQSSTKMKHDFNNISIDPGILCRQFSGPADADLRILLKALLGNTCSVSSEGWRRRNSSAAEELKILPLYRSLNATDTASAIIYSKTV